MKNTILKLVRFSLTLSLSFSLLACELIEEGAACTDDFECDAGSLCGDDGFCAEALPGDEKDFGEVTLNFETGDEAYILGVYPIPVTAETEGGFVRFELASAGNDAAMALTQLPAQGEGLSDAQRAYWDDRIAFENQRHEGITKLVDAVRSGERSLLQKTSVRAVDCGGCDTGEICWHGACTDSPVVKFADGTDITCEVLETVVEGSATVSVLWDSASTGSTANAITAAQQYAKAMSRELTILGQGDKHEGALDRDEDGMMTVVFSDKLAELGSGNIVGFFDYRDFLAAGDTDASGNEADLLWSRAPGDESLQSCADVGGCTDDITLEVAVGTLVHEYTHLVSFASRVWARPEAPLREVLWLDEGLAHLMEDINGYGASNLGALWVSLDEWPIALLGSSADSVEQRGRAYLFLRHILDARAKSAGSGDAWAAATSASAYSFIGELVNEVALGFDHAIFRDNADYFWGYQIGAYTTDNPEVTFSGANAYDYLPQAAATTGQQTGALLFGDGVDARGVEIICEGPRLGDGSTAELYEFTDVFESDVPDSGGYLFLVTSSELGEVVLRGRGAAELDLRLDIQRVR